jgi:hypothetical protein
MRRFLQPLLFAALLSTGILCRAEPATDVPELATILSLFSAHAATDGVRLNWTLDKQSPTILQFRIYRGYTEVGNFAVLSDVDVHPAKDTVDYSYTDTTIRAGVSYFYKIAAVGQKGESVFPVVITATPPQAGQSSEAHKDLSPAMLLPGEKITLYVRTAGHVRLAVLSRPVKALVDDVLQPGIYEFDPPASTFTLRLKHELGPSMDIAWPIP